MSCIKMVRNILPKSTPAPVRPAMQSESETQVSQSPLAMLAATCSRIDSTAGTSVVRSFGSSDAALSSGLRNTATASSRFDSRVGVVDAASLPVASRCGGGEPVSVSASAALVNMNQVQSININGEEALFIPISAASHCLQKIPTIAAGPNPSMVFAPSQLQQQSQFPAFFQLSTPAANVSSQHSAANASTLQHPVGMVQTPSSANAFSLPSSAVTVQIPVASPFVSMQLPVVTPDGQTIMETVQMPWSQWLELMGGQSTSATFAPFALQSTQPQQVSPTAGPSAPTWLTSSASSSPATPQESPAQLLSPDRSTSSVRSRSATEVENSIGQIIRISTNAANDLEEDEACLKSSVRLPNNVSANCSFSSVVLGAADAGAIGESDAHNNPAAATNRSAKRTARARTTLDESIAAVLNAASQGTLNTTTHLSESANHILPLLDRQANATLPLAAPNLSSTSQQQPSFVFLAATPQQQPQLIQPFSQQQQQPSAIFITSAMGGTASLSMSSIQQMGNAVIIQSPQQQQPSQQSVVLQQQQPQQSSFLASNSSGLVTVQPSFQSALFWPATPGFVQPQPPPAGQSPSTFVQMMPAQSSTSDAPIITPGPGMVVVSDDEDSPPEKRRSKFRIKRVPRRDDLPNSIANWLATAADAVAQEEDSAATAKKCIQVTASESEHLPHRLPVVSSGPSEWQVLASANGQSGCEMVQTSSAIPAQQQHPSFILFPGGTGETTANAGFTLPSTFAVSQQQQSSIAFIPVNINSNSGFVLTQEGVKTSTSSSSCASVCFTSPPGSAIDGSNIYAPPDGRVSPESRIFFRGKTYQVDPSDPTKWLEFISPARKRYKPFELPKLPKLVPANSLTTVSSNGQVFVIPQSVSYTKGGASKGDDNNGGRQKRTPCTCSICLANEGKPAGERVQGHICDLGGCGKRYSKTSHLRAHLRLHAGLRPFACDFPACTRRFTRSDELQRHKRTHTGEKNFVCDLCQKRFPRSDHLLKHKRGHEFGTLVKPSLRIASGDDADLEENANAEEQFVTAVEAAVNNENEADNSDGTSSCSSEYAADELSRGFEIRVL